jgi:hypothetical protein
MGGSAIALASIASTGSPSRRKATQLDRREPRQRRDLTWATRPSIEALPPPSSKGA